MSAAVATAAVSSSSSSSTDSSSSQLLTRSILGDQLTRSRASSVNDTPLDPSQMEAPSPSRSRRASHSSRKHSIAVDGSPSDATTLDSPFTDAPSSSNLNELNDLLRELHRNQLWFIYVFSSAREQFQNGTQKQMDQVSQTVG